MDREERARRVQAIAPKIREAVLRSSPQDVADAISVSDETVKKAIGRREVDNPPYAPRVDTLEKLEDWARNPTLEKRAEDREIVADWLAWLSVLARRGLLPGLQLGAIRQEAENGLSEAGSYRELADALDRLGSEDVANSGSD